MNSNIRTDLALEARELLGGGEEIPGLRCEEREEGSFRVSTVEVLDSRGEQAIGKPRGRYITIELDGLIRREENAFSSACALISSTLSGLPELKGGGTVLVVGLGNRGITPDAVGPAAIDHIMVTRHLRQQLPEQFGAFRPVSAMCSGVLGTTGMESSESVAAIAALLKPSLIIAVDALASREPMRLCRTVQISDTGIVPGSGVGNARRALDRKTLGIPVLAVGVPTVVDAATLASGLAARSGVRLREDSLSDARQMIVTPRDIDRNVSDISKLIGYSINLALHSGLSLEDVDMFLS